MSKYTYEGMRNRLNCIKTMLIEQIVHLLNKTSAKKVQLDDDLKFNLRLGGKDGLYLAPSCALAEDGTLVVNVYGMGGTSTALSAEGALSLSVDTLNELVERVRKVVPQCECRDMNGVGAAQLFLLLSQPEVRGTNPLVVLSVQDIEPVHTKILRVVFERESNMLWLELSSAYDKGLTKAFSDVLCEEEDEEADETDDEARSKSMSRRLKSYPVIVYKDGRVVRWSGEKVARDAFRRCRKSMNLREYEEARFYVMHSYTSGNIALSEVK